MRTPLILLLAGAVSACSPPIPDSGKGIGFNSSFDAMRAAELEQARAGTEGPMLIPAPAVSDEALPAAPQVARAATPEGTPSSALVVPAAPQPQTTETFVANAGSDAELAAETAAALAASRANSGVAPVVASPANPAPPLAGHPGLSSENDFKAVSSARSIESDAERLAANRQQYQVVQPSALPARSGKEGPNIVDYALKTNNPRGVKLYNRVGINLAGRAQRACGHYPSPDQAQIDFLASGGPERDKLGLDPDGDGYACAWNPAPFRTAVKS